MTAPFLAPRIIPKIGLAPMAMTMAIMTQCQIENDPIVVGPSPASCARFIFPLLGRLTGRESSLLFRIYNTACLFPKADATRQLR